MARSSEGHENHRDATLLAFPAAAADKRRPMVQVKICGITRQEDASAVLRAGADFAGLVFHRNSPRCVKSDQARALAASLRGRVRVVALVADAADHEIAEAVTAADPDFIQLHGTEPPERVAFIRARFRKPVIKALGIAAETDFAPLESYEDVADMLLFDAKPPLRGSIPGGHGRSFDWHMMRTRKIRKPWLLAGGLDAGNVSRAINSAGAPGVDVSSGVEIAPGVKSADAISDFIAAARATGPVGAAQP